MTGRNWGGKRGGKGAAPDAEAEVEQHPWAAEPKAKAAPKAKVRNKPGPKPKGSLEPNAKAKAKARAKATPRAKVKGGPSKALEKANARQNNGKGTRPGGAEPGPVPQSPDFIRFVISNIS